MFTGCLHEGCHGKALTVPRAEGTGSELRSPVCSVVITPEKYPSPIIYSVPESSLLGYKGRARPVRLVLTQVRVAPVPSRSWFSRKQTSPIFTGLTQFQT